MDKISVIVPVYNVEDYLHECVASIRNQTYENLEIILIDDGSTDNSGIMCDLYAEADGRIKVIHKENGGMSDARNAGLDVATGEYIGFVDADDYIDADMYELLYKNIKEYNSNVSMCKSRFVVNNKAKREMNDNKPFICASPKSILKEIYFGRGTSMVVWLRLYEADIFKDIRFKKGKAYEDAYISWDIVKNTKRMVVQYTSKYNYRQRVGSITHAQVFNEKIIDNIEAYKYVWEQVNKDNKDLLPIIESKIWWSYRTALSQIYFTDDKNEHKDKIRYIKNVLYENKTSIFINPYVSIKQKLILLIIFFFPEAYCYLYRKYTN